MRLKCHKCQHAWDDPDAEGSPVVQCPECMVIVPMAIAKAGGAGGSGASPSAPTRPSISSPKTGAIRKPIAPEAEKTFIPTPKPAASKLEPTQTFVPNKPAAPPTPPKPDPGYVPPSQRPGPPPKPAIGASLVKSQRNAPLGCTKCPHQWSDDIDEGQSVVQCPECMAVIPTSGALRAAKPRPAAATQPSPLMPQPKTETRPAIGGAAPVRPAPAAPAAPPAGETRKSPAAAPPRVAARRSSPPSGPAIQNLADTSPDPLDGTIRLKSTGAEDDFLQALSTGNIKADDVSDISENITVIPATQPPPVSKPSGSKAPLRPARRPAHAEHPDVSDMPTVLPASKPAMAAGIKSRPAVAAASAPEWERQTRTGGGVSEDEIPTEIDATPFDLAGKTIGGYEIIKRLGAGGMGEVALARQISLDREVALKILPARFAKAPEFLMRFTREALSAAQLTHHNIIQVYDVGEDQGVRYISMEFVKGKNLGDIVREEGKMELESAAGYVLQAARGLKYAHERGIIHRDIKPDNLMVNEHGLVKIADMGLAKMNRVADVPLPNKKADPTLLAKAKGDLTETEIAMGTPAYMPPEQAQDASKVDHRADQYSLGCTLYYLCAGRAPFTGASAMEIISQHIGEPPPPLDQHVRRVPSALNTIITRMLQKQPEDRYPSMAQVITDLEAYLGVESEKGAYSPTERHVETLELEEMAYNNAPAARLRKFAVRGFAIAFPLAVAAMIALRGAFELGPRLAAALLGVLVLTPLANFLLDGLFNKTFLFRRVRSVFFGMTIKGWAYAVSGALLLAAALYVFQPVTWLASLMLAFGLSLIYQKAIIRKLKAQRAAPLGEVQKMLKQLRIRGVSEDALQDFVYRYSGEYWEELFEELFGYGAMIFARTKWALVDRIKPRKKFATWRDPIARWLDEVEESRKRARERKALARAELERLRAKGIEEKFAQQRAKEAADKTLQEGLLKPTVILKPGETVLEGKGVKITSWDASGVHGPGFSRKSMAFTAFQIARIVIGGVVCALFAMHKLGMAVPLPGPLSMLEPTLKSIEPMLHSYWGLAAGLVVLITAFSSGTIMPIIALIGAILLVGQEPIVNLVNQPTFTATTANLAGLGAMAVGFGMCLADKLMGGKF